MDDTRLDSLLSTADRLLGRGAIAPAIDTILKAISLLRSEVSSGTGPGAPEVTGTVDRPGIGKISYSIEGAVITANPHLDIEAKVHGAIEHYLDEVEAATADLQLR